MTKKCLEGRICVICGKEFDVKRGKYKTCSPECSKKLHKKWFKDNKEHVNNYWNERKKRIRKESPESRKKMNKATKNWKLNHPNAQKIYRTKNRKLTNAYAEKYYKEDSEKIKEILGSLCILCGSSKRVCLHEIHGKRHITLKYYILQHIEDFIPLCFNCHNSLHKMSKTKNINWKKFFELRDLLLFSKEKDRSSWV